MKRTKTVWKVLLYAVLIPFLVSLPSFTVLFSGSGRMGLAALVPPVLITVFYLIFRK